MKDIMLKVDAINTFYGKAQVLFDLSLEVLRGEVVVLLGSKEGIAHLPLCLIDPGDVSLITDPGYPVYEVATMFAGGESVRIPLTEENGWLPRLTTSTPQTPPVRGSSG